MRGWTALSDLGLIRPLSGTSFSFWAGAVHTEAALRISASRGRTWEVKGSSRQPRASGWRQGDWPHQGPRDGVGGEPSALGSSWASAGHAQKPAFYKSLVQKLGGVCTPLDGLREGTGAAGGQEVTCESLQPEFPQHRPRSLGWDLGKVRKKGV